MNDQGRPVREIPDGLEVAPATEGDKQVVQPEKEVSYLQDDFPIPVEGAHGDEDRKGPLENVELSHGPKSGTKTRKVCGMRIKMLIILLAVGTVFILGLAIGLGVGLSSTKDSSEPSSEPSDSVPSPSTSPPVQDAFSIGGGLDESYYSTKGAWNGSGIAHSWQTFSSDEEGPIQGQEYVVVYYQHHSGAVRWMRRFNDSIWLRGSDDSEDVAVDAKDATPISSVSGVLNVTYEWHVFCKQHISSSLHHCKNFKALADTWLRHR